MTMRAIECNDIDARLIEQVLPGVRALPLADAAPASISLVWAKERPHPRLQALLECAAEAQAAPATEPSA